MTLIELTVVIAVILVLISVLFVGANYYRKAANTAACVINLTSITKAAHAHKNVTQEEADFDFLTSTTGPLGQKPPTCPDSGDYTVTWTAGSGSSNIASTACDFDGGTAHVEPTGTATDL